jgi:hypothetical protein
VLLLLHASHTHEAGRTRLRELTWKLQPERSSEKNPQKKKGWSFTPRTEPNRTEPNRAGRVQTCASRRLAGDGGLVAVRKPKLKRAPSPGRNQPPPPRTTRTGRGPPTDLIRARQP